MQVDNILCWGEALAKVAVVNDETGEEDTYKGLAAEVNDILRRNLAFIRWAQLGKSEEERVARAAIDLKRLNEIGMEGLEFGKGRFATIKGGADAAVEGAGAAGAAGAESVAGAAGAVGGAGAAGAKGIAGAASAVAESLEGAFGQLGASVG